MDHELRLLWKRLTARKVPGRNTMPRRDMVFIWLLSSFVLLAMMMVAFASLLVW
jgi:hypothetical protein